MASNYPSGYDSFSLHHDNSGERVAAGDINKIQDSVLAIQTELGLNPKGTSADVGARLAATAGAVALAIIFGA